MRKPSPTEVLRKRISSTFKLAGWDVNFNPTAQEMRNPNTFTGIDVRGFNEHLVGVVANAVTMLGGWDVRTRVESLTISKDNPKFVSSEQKVYVTIGDPSYNWQTVP